MEGRYGKYGFASNDCELVDEDGGDINDAPQDANTSEDCEPDPEPRYPNGSHLFGGGSGI
jgi:hypothetical protein